jgi:RNA polymerase sigma-70 factor (ECF subfamily)
VVTITETSEAGHGPRVPESRAQPLALARSPADAPAGKPTFDQVYEEHFDFVWRNLRRLGVAPAGLWDAAQEVFVVVHRRLADYEARGALRSWLYSIVVRVSRQLRRTARRKPAFGSEDSAELADAAEAWPDQRAERSEALERLMALLETLDEAKREAFVLAELEGLTAPEIASILNVNLNTVYSRIRVARQELEAAIRAEPASMAERKDGR